MKPACAVTGATGYVGSRLASSLSADFTIVPLSRNAAEGGIRWALGSIDSIAEKLRASGVTTLVHSAWDFSYPKSSENWQTNVAGSVSLLDDAVAAGVQRVVFISTISAFDGVHSEYGKAKLAVEHRVLALGGTVIRPGLVWGDRPGGMFGSLRKQTAKSGLVPMIGDGNYPQFLVHENDLGEIVRRAALGEFGAKVLTAAHPHPWPLKELILRMAREQGTSVRTIGIPSRLIHAGLKVGEALGLKLPFRSDSVVSLTRQNPDPLFARELDLRPFV